VNVCSSRCGWCGRCETDTRNEALDVLRCDKCGDDAFHPITLQGVGIACSRKCMDVLTRQHEAAMMPRQKVSA
jgi:hypothetical protein